MNTSQCCLVWELDAQQKMEPLRTDSVAWAFLFADQCVARMRLELGVRSSECLSKVAMECCYLMLILATSIASLSSRLQTEHHAVFSTCFLLPFSWTRSHLLSLYEPHSWSFETNWCFAPLTVLVLCPSDSSSPFAMDTSRVAAYFHAKTGRLGPSCYCSERKLVGFGSLECLQSIESQSPQILSQSSSSTSSWTLCVWSKGLVHSCWSC